MGAGCARSRFGAAILAGGDAVRYGGVVKGLLRLPDGRTIIGRLMAEARAAGAGEIAIIANDPEPYRSFGSAAGRRDRPGDGAPTVVADRRTGAGPIAGVESALAHFAGRCEAALLLACDMPAITREEMGALVKCFVERKARAVVAETADGWHPLCAVAATAVHAEVTQAIEEGVRKVGDLWRRLGAVAVRFDDGGPFFNVNTPEDWAQWLRALAAD
jgi:molybdopterin-guanine dinucleotide biosynthesis protein A